MNSHYNGSLQTKVCSCPFLIEGRNCMKEKKIKGSRNVLRPTRIVVERKYVGKEKMEEVFRHIAEEEIQNKANKLIASA